jgi:SAM-dependent methyltransferase
MPKDSFRLYDALAPHYEEYSSNYHLYLQAIENLTISEISPGMRILDVGSGDGRRLRKIMDLIPGIQCTAIEPSPQMAEICRKNIGDNVVVTPVEKIADLDIDNFDLAISLWNVLGHISLESRVLALEVIADKLAQNGKILLDINNRHNAVGYGYLKVLMRYFVDLVNFNSTRGDTEYEWKIGDKNYKGYGHLFTPQEAQEIFRKAGLKVCKRLTVNYRSGKVSKSRFLGQLFYVLQKH